QDYGIEVIKEAAGVGQNLQDHYQIRTIVRLQGKQSLNDQVRNPFKLAQMGLQWLLRASGPLTVGAGQVGGGVMTRYAHDKRPDVQLNVMPLSVDKPGQPLHRFSGFTAGAWQCHPESRGELNIQSADPMQQPRIEPRYLSHEMDRNVMVESVKIIRGIYAQPAFRNLWNKEMVPGAEIETDDELLDYVRQTGGTVFHPVGTCRMGQDDSAVVDPQLRVNGVHGLRVIDASVMPTVTSANTNAPTLMIAQKGADTIVREYSL
ncbi:MAG: choline dehydrogenase, partial [Gammaproteobacteria bacterium]